jgi:hypothetical protein
MSERRSYFRVRTSACVALRPVAEETIEQARARVRARHVDPPIPSGTIEERRLSTENRAVLDLVQRVAVTLARIDQRLDDLVQAQRGEAPDSVVPADPMEISISGSGFACPIKAPLEPGTLLEVTLDLRDAGVPLIPALVRVVRCSEIEGRPVAGLRFVEIVPEDRERIVQLTLRRQSSELRRRRMGGER